MAATLVNAALSGVRPAHATYYGEVNDRNPVIVAIRKELNEFCSYVEKSKHPDYKREENEACSRASNWLFDVWNKYALRLPTEFYYDKLIETGDYLSSEGSHQIALHQCYDYFLITCYGVPSNSGCINAKSCGESYFRDDFKSKLAITTCQALAGAFNCKFHIIQKTDPDFVRCDSIEECCAALRGLQVFMQCIQKHESLHWMLYNCTIICYQMCRKLMTSGNSIKAIEFLVWSAVCMESSIPLLAVKFLTWRVTLYTTVCLAYYDSKAGQLAEKFARRSLTKLQELSELEAMSGAEESETTRLVFQQATVKMAAMVFKRTVFESRKKPKGLLRPKMRNNLKEAAQLVWPRTATEKLLGDMFVGSAAQFLAILEALTNSHRRCFQSQPPAADTETEMLDVFAELFFAGKEIVAGGGGAKNQNASGADHSVMAGIRGDKSLIQLAAAGEDGVTLVSVVRFIKLAFCYEQWETFSALLDSALLYIKKSETEIEGETVNKGPELCLALMLVLERVLRSKSLKRMQQSTSASATNITDEKAFAPAATQSSLHGIQASDDLVNLAETVYYCITSPTLFSPFGKDQEFLLDRDMVLDACKILWKRCKAVLSKLQNLSQSDNSVSQKWIHLLQIIHSAFVWCGIAGVDPPILAEVSLRLALLLESASCISEGDVTDMSRSRLSMFSAGSLYQTKADRLASACEILSGAINSLCAGRTLNMSFNGKDVSDIMWMQNCHEMDVVDQKEAMVRDLHVELLNTHHRIYLKFSKLGQPEAKHKPPNSSRSSVMTSKQLPEYNKKKMLGLVGGNLVSNALLQAQRADIELNQDSHAAEVALKKAASLLRRAEEEEERLYHLSKYTDETSTPISLVVPPPPVLLARSDTTMVFKPGPFYPKESSVAWYRLFGRTSAGPNVKVRLNDYFLQGAGNEVPAGKNSIFRVDGLRGNQRYVFAVAAYSSDGTLIGNSIGSTSEVIPAHHPMSILNAWSILAEVSHRVGVREVAKQATDILWNRFVAPPPESDSDTWTTSIGTDFKLTLYSLQKEMIMASSQVLLRHVVVSMFISVDVSVQEGGLFCNKLCDDGPLLPGQIRRLCECERMLVAIELSSFLNDQSYLLQAATQCYGLLVPLIQSDVYSMPVVQVLAKCHAVLRESCGGSRSQRSPMVNNSVHHMIASITYYLSKVMRSWGRSEACLSMIDAGKLLLNPGEQVQTVVRNLESNGEPSTVNITQTKKRGVKPVSMVNASMSHELTALEERLAELTKEKHSADELTGGEDASTVLSYIVTAKPMLAYKEISKFRRRSRYLEYFVHVMHKALHVGLVEPTIEWSQEILVWLRRRNENLSVNHTLMSIENGAIVMQGNDPNKYAAVLVSYGQETSKTKDKKKKMQRKKSRAIVRGLGDEQEELERKAMGVLEKHFIEIYKNSVKRRKLRKLSYDEMPWRAEFNQLLGLLHLDMLLQKLERRSQLIHGNVIPSKHVNIMDQKIWSLDGCNSIVLQPSTVSNKPVNVKSNIMIEADEDDPGQALLTAARQAIDILFGTDANAGINVQTAQEEENARNIDSPKTQRTNSPISLVSTQTLDPNAAAVQNAAIVETFKVCMLSFRRALVLAHRGKHWTLLQNVARSLLSCISVVPEQSINVNEPVMTIQEFRTLAWFPMSLASDFILDMLVCMQESKSKDWPVDSYAGDIVTEKGGSNLWFDVLSDDAHAVDFPVIKATILRSIQMLHFEGRWEFLTDICLRFTALTHERFSETVSPIMIHAQHKILKRVREYGGENALQIAVDNQRERVQFDNHNYIKCNMQINPIDPNSSFQVDIGGYIDPGAHDVYGGGKRALALSCVPYDVNDSLLNLHDNLKKSRYLSRALIHSRKLLGLYLASQYNGREPRSTQSSAKQDTRGSSVGFVDIESTNQQPFPSSLTNTEFVQREDVESVPFGHLPTVIESYVKSIELLTSHGERDLVGQANHELGNLYLHNGNEKAALKAWNKGLDQVFEITNTLTQWNRLFENVDDIPQSMLQKLGPWGCLLAVVLTCKIGEFMDVNLQLKSNCALLAAELVMAIFRVSLPHPTSNTDYLLYEIFPQHVLQNNSKPQKYMPGSTSIFPNVDLFSDQYRCESKQLLACLHWLSETLVQMQYNFKAFPCLCLYQYLATFVCKDIQRSVQCRCIKLNALNNIRAFDVAVNDLCILLFGSKLPHITDNTYREPDSMVPNIQFNLSQSIETLDNLKAMEVIVSKRLSASLSQLYGPELTCEITIQQSRLIVELADCITCIPQRPKLQDLIFVSSESTQDSSAPLPGGSPSKGPQSVISDDVRSTISAMSSASAYRQVKKLFSKRDSPMTIPLLKGILLAVSEALSTSMLNPIADSQAKLTPCELWVAIQCNFILSNIEIQRQHSAIAASHALKALKLMQSAEIFDDLSVKPVRQIRSALRNRRMDKSQRANPSTTEKEIDNLEHKYRVRLNSRLWLQIRLQLCDALRTQIVGLGKVRGAITGESGSSNHTLLQIYSAEGLVEAEACNDLEMQSAFLIYGSQVDGLSSEETIKTLEDAVATLDEMPYLSDKGTITLVQGTIAIADLQLQTNKWTSSHAVQEFHNAHAIMLLHAMHHGETIRHSHQFSSMIDMPCKNMYHRYLHILAHIKLRIAHANYFTLSDTSAVEEWQVTTEILKQARALCEGSAEKDPRLLAEINFELGRMTRALYFMNGCNVEAVESAVQTAIKTAHISDPSASRNGHLELAMLGITLNTDSQALSQESSSRVTSIERISMALQTAHSIAEANQTRALLPGNTTVTSLEFTDNDKAALPDFVVLDLSTTHTDIPQPVTVEDITIDPIVMAAQIESGNFTWIHVLHYRVLLLRKFSSVRISYENRPETSESDESSMDEFYPGDQKQTDSRSQATKTPLFSGYLATRSSYLHEYLREHLPAYEETCKLPAFDSKASVLLVQWYKVRHKVALLWCKTDSQECGKLLITPSDMARLLGQIKALLQKVEIHFGQTMAPVEKLRSRNIRQRKPSSLPQVPAQLEDDIKQTLTNCALLFSPDHDVITSLPFQVTVHAVENMVELFTIGCCYTPTDPLYDWLSQLLITSSEN